MWKIDDIVRTVLGAKDGCARAQDIELKGWLLTRADVHHGRSVVLYDACAVVHVLFNGSIETVAEPISYRVQSTFRSGKLVSRWPAPELLRGADHYSAQWTAAQALRSSYVLGYRAEGQELGAMDSADYEEARRRSFENVIIIFAAIKAGGIIARGPVRVCMHLWLFSD